jgi:hypothetical protein
MDASLKVIGPNESPLEIECPGQRVNGVFRAFADIGFFGLRVRLLISLSGN